MPIISTILLNVSQNFLCIEHKKTAINGSFFVFFHNMRVLIWRGILWYNHKKNTKNLWKYTKIYKYTCIQYYCIHVYNTRILVYTHIYCIQYTHGIHVYIHVYTCIQSLSVSTQYKWVITIVSTRHEWVLIISTRYNWVLIVSTRIQWVLIVKYFTNMFHVKHKNFLLTIW